MEKELNYFEDLEFDNDKLDEAVDKQHILNMRYYELYADKIEEVDESKRILKIKDAEMKEKWGELYLKYKQEKIDGKSPTDKYVESLILVDDEYKKKQKIYFNAIKKVNTLQKQCNILEGVVKSFQQRKNGLEIKRDLFIFGWYGEVKQKNSKEKIINNIHDKLNRRKNEDG
jgi:hypothetical protein